MTPWVWILSRIGRPSDTEDKQTLFGKILNLKNVNNQNFNTINNKIGDFSDTNEQNTIFGQLKNSGNSIQLLFATTEYDSDLETYFATASSNTNQQMPTSNLVFQNGKYYVFDYDKKLYVKNTTVISNPETGWSVLSNTPTALYHKDTRNRMMYIYNNLIHILCPKTSSGNILLYYTFDGSTFSKKSDVQLQSGTYTTQNMSSYCDLGDYILIKDSTQLSETNKTVKYSLINKATMKVSNFSFDYTASGYSEGFKGYGRLETISIIHGVPYLILIGFTSNSYNTGCIVVYKSSNTSIESADFKFYKSFGSGKLISAGSSYPKMRPDYACSYMSGNSLVITFCYENSESVYETKGYIFDGNGLKECGLFKNIMFTNQSRFFIADSMYGFTRQGIPYSVNRSVNTTSSRDNGVAGAITVPSFSIFLKKGTIFDSQSNLILSYTKQFPYEPYEYNGKNVLKMTKDDQVIIPSVYDIDGNIVKDCSCITILS